jgi:hypothetical protein
MAVLAGIELFGAASRTLRGDQLGSGDHRV